MSERQLSHAEQLDREYKDLLALTSGAVADGRVDFSIDFKRLTHPNCPIPFHTQTTRIAYLYLVLCCVGAGIKVWLGLPWIPVLAGLAVFTLVYWTLIRGRAERQIALKIQRELFADSASWDKVWRYGGMRLSRRDGDREIVAEAPKDPWLTFMREFRDALKPAGQ
ncbi:MAG: hypothetical protein JNL04_06520 [Rhodospirillaceae bacterium]|nr:hypothetical protein [Rhodospirillaceae bacterium]